jgi:hypothetical protein
MCVMKIQLVMEPLKDCSHWIKNAHGRFTRRF